MGCPGDFSINKNKFRSLNQISRPLMVNPVRSRPKSGRSFYLAPYCKKFERAHAAQCQSRCQLINVHVAPARASASERHVFFNGSITDYVLKCYDHTLAVTKLSLYIEAHSIGMWYRHPNKDGTGIDAARSRKRETSADCGLDPRTSGFGGGRAIHWAMEAPLYLIQRLHKLITEIRNYSSKYGW